jgi:peptidoglycan-N-acetylglucosamine deacetylase
MEISAKPVFYTPGSSRWNRFLWTVKILAVVFGIGLSAIMVSLFHKQVFNLPTLHEHLLLTQDDIQKIRNDDVLGTETKHFIALANRARKLVGHNFYKKDKVIPGEIKKLVPVRAAFYVNWDIQSKYSLKHNASKMNMILPEWIFIQDTSDVVSTEIDLDALDIMQQNKLAIIPMISNYFNNKWNGENVHRIITSPERRTRLINSIIKVLDKYRLNGVNIDFEDLDETTDEYMISFQKELYKELHNRGYYVTQDIAPFNEDYNVAELEKYNDFLFLMGYDLHNATSAPGPIAPQYWIEAALGDLCRKVPSDKIVLCIAAFGYDWQSGYQGQDVTFPEAITTALESEGKIKFDNNNYNLNYSYYDENDKLHKVFFADAATAYNAIRTAADFETSGVSVWYLGSEDDRLWQFYNRDLSASALATNPFNIDILQILPSTNDVDYNGAGEVLNIMTEPQPGKFKLEYNFKDNLISEEEYISLPTGYVINKTGEKTKEIVMTFDDGPDENYTPRILDILSKNKVPAVFFMTGINAEENLPLVKRVYKEGHEIGNHTFLHPNLELISDDRLKLELRSTGYIIESITGHNTILFRPPYNTDAEPTNPAQIKPIYTAKEEGYLTIGSSIDPRDWEEDVSEDTIVSRAIAQQRLGNIILMHDAGGYREETIKALPRIISYYKSHGYRFVSLAQLIGKKRDDLMPRSSGSFNKYLESADATVFKTGYIFNRVISAIFFLAMILSLIRIVSVAILAARQKKISKKPVNKPLPANGYKVSIIVPGYNEEITASRTIENLLKSDYHDFEVVFIDDGSTDNTLRNIQSLFSEQPNVKILTKPNGGKASALNYGIGFSSGEILVCIDADTMLSADAVSKMIVYFNDPLVAAVAGNVKVGNRNNQMTRWQSIEYITSQNFDRRAFDTLNAIMVVPGAIGAFRREAVMKVGMFSTDTLAEDCDLTIRLLLLGYKVRTCNDALAFTEVPETLQMLLKQRFRWTFGIMQVFWKHHGQMFVRHNPNLGWVVLPNMLVFQLILPILSPLVDITLLFSILMPKGGVIVLLYIGYYLTDLLISAFAFHYDGEKFTLRNAYNLFLQRILYRQVLWYVLLKGYLRAIKGELAAWGILKRTGNVETI